MNSKLKALDSYCQYTVGWLAPLPIERAAAEALLDEKHGQPHNFQQPPNDTLSYSWGSIGRHNIVIASLKSGIYGTTSAATTAGSMLSTFSEIRFGLLVGIGGGIPRPDDGYDIRLGDIVVSDPSGSTGGVVQYDLVKAKAGERERKDFLNSPPNVLLYALANLKNQHEQKPSKVPEILQEMKEQNPFMFKKRASNPGYGYQGHENDRLFKSSYAHVKGNDCRGCSREEEVDREPRENEEPEIHYGVIASGNTLVKDSVARDDMLKHIPEDCICYEMEAAGLMNDFPCLVIRGICDYADSHKNDRWQRYAAATAAAFAKELLGIVRPEMVEKTERAAQAINAIAAEMKEVHNVSKETNVRVHEDQVKRWLNPPDISTNDQKAKSQRHRGTCQWFLKSEKFGKWNITSQSCIWLYGIAGCGKTILSSAIIQALRETSITSSQAILYFYFDFGDTSKQSCSDMLRSFLYQLYCANDAARSELNKVFGSRCGGLPEAQNLFEIFRAVAKHFEDVKIVLDALDEVKQRAHRKEILSWITEIVQSACGRFHTIVTSRSEADISSVLCQLGQVVHISSDTVAPDISKYVQATISGQSFQRWHENYEVQQRIETALTRKANGMFRWVSCQIEVLEDCLDRRSLEQALASLPTTLNETYDRCLSRIPEPHKRGALRILQFLTFSEHAIQVGEAADFIAVDLSREPEFDPKDRMPDFQDMKHYCPSLLTIHKGKPNQKVEMFDTVRLAHFTVKEYLISGKVDVEFRQHFEELHARASMFQISLGYINALYSTDKIVHWNIPFAISAFRDLMTHARFSEEDPAVFGKLQQFLHSSQVFKAWICRMSADTELALQHARRSGLSGSDLLPSPLFIATYFELERSCKKLCNEPIGSSIPRGDKEIIPFGFFLDGHTGISPISPLYVASDYGNDAMVTTLLKDVVALTKVGGPLGTALDVACSRGHERVVDLILCAISTHGCQLDLHRLLQTAAGKGNMKTVQVLLDHGVSMNQLDLEKMSAAVHAAARGGHNEVIQLLFHHLRKAKSLQETFSESSKDSVNHGDALVQISFQKDTAGKTLLHHAALLDNEGLAKTLIRAVQSSQNTPLLLSTSEQAEHTISNSTENDSSEGEKKPAEPVEQTLTSRLLQITDNTGMTALHVAIANQHLTTSYILLEAAKSVCAPEALLHKTDSKSETLAQYMVEADDPKLTGELSKFAHSSETFADLLQNQDQAGRTLLHRAVSRSQPEMTVMVLEMAGSSNTIAALLPIQDHEGNTALHLGTLTGHRETIKRLLLAAKSIEAVGELIRTKNNRGLTPLHCAVLSEETDTAAMLLNAVDSPRIVADMLRTGDVTGKTPLHLAIFYHQRRQAEFILGVAQSLSLSEDLLRLTDDSGMTALHYTAQDLDFTFMTVLVEAGADPASLSLEGICDLSGIRSNPVIGRCVRAELGFLDNEGLLDSSAFPLHEAAKNGDARLALQFIEQEEMVVDLLNSRDDSFGRTPLHWAAIGGWPKVVELFLSWGAEVNPQDNRGNTPLHCAAQAGHPKIVNMLSNQGGQLYVSEGAGQENEVDMLAVTPGDEEGIGEDVEDPSEPDEDFEFETSSSGSVPEEGHQVDDGDED